MCTAREVCCGGINPYTLTARLGLGDLAHYETVRGLFQLFGVSRKEIRRGDQAGFWSVRIGIDIVLSMAIVTDRLGLVSRFVTLPSRLYKERQGTPLVNSNHLRSIQSDA